MELKPFVCPNCKAPLVPIKDARFMFCDYCGTRIIIDDIDYYREDSKTERARIRAEKGAEVELQRLKNEKHKNIIKVIIAIIIAYMVILVAMLAVTDKLLSWMAMIQ